MLAWSLIQFLKMHFFVSAARCQLVRCCRGISPTASWDGPVASFHKDHVPRLDLNRKSRVKAGYLWMASCILKCGPYSITQVHYFVILEPVFFHFSKISNKRSKDECKTIFPTLSLANLGQVVLAVDDLASHNTAENILALLRESRSTL